MPSSPKVAKASDASAKMARGRPKKVSSSSSSAPAPEEVPKELRQFNKPPKLKKAAANSVPKELRQFNNPPTKAPAGLSVKRTAATKSAKVPVKRTLKTTKPLSAAAKAKAKAKEADAKAKAKDKAKKVKEKAKEKAAKAKAKAKAKKAPVSRKWTEEQKTAAAVKRQSRSEGARDRMYRSVEDWEGNSDDEGSVDSGAMEEDICFECGKLTTHDDPEAIIMCDICASEIHLACLGLNMIPRKGYVCPRCKEDEYAFGDLNYDVYKPDRYNLGARNITRVSNFPIPKRTKNTRKIEYVYSPSRPLEEAWKECVEKGFMSVSRVFDAPTMIKLTHGALTNATKSGRSAEKWAGALQEIENKIGGNIVTNMIDRNGRYDMRLPDFVIDQLGINEKLRPILDKLTSIMGNPKPVIRTQNVVFVPVGSHAQEWHIDDQPSKTHRYFTILIHLNPVDEMCGGTELYHKQLKKGDMVRNRPGDAFIFNGSMLHRGQANEGQTHRLFYYASFACRKDVNIAV